MTYLEQKNYNKNTIAELKNEQKGYNEKPIVNGGYPIFNTCDHTTLDMSKIEGNDMHTLSIKLDEKRYITLCFMKMMNGSYINIDTKLHGAEEYRNHVINFQEGGVSRDKIDNLNLMAIISELKK